MAKKKVQYFIEVAGKKVPVHFYWERRSNVRFAIGKKGVLVRFPRGLSKKQEAFHLQRLKDWLKKSLLQQQGLLDHLAGKSYESGDRISVGERTYELRIVFEARKTMACRLEGKLLHIKLPREADEQAISRNMKRLLSKAIGQDFLPEIRRRVETINRKYFGEEIKEVKLRYNTSSWGNCHTNGTITLSTRLLFAPSEVIDYVIIHELAHLKVFDHSPEFWELVARAMPSYKRQEKWLKENYYQCDF